MNDNNKQVRQPSNHSADIEALSEAIDLAPLGVLPSGTIAQLINLRERLNASRQAP